MKKNIVHFALMGAAMLAGSAITQAPEAPATKAAEASLPVGCSNELKAPKPQHQKPAQQPVTRRTVTVRQQPIAYEGAPVFQDMPQRRRVKYGKRRWVILG